MAGNFSGHACSPCGTLWFGNVQSRFGSFGVRIGEDPTNIAARLSKVAFSSWLCVVSDQPLTADQPLSNSMQRQRQDCRSLAEEIGPTGLTGRSALESS